MPWLGHSCGTCPFCRMGQENLCDALHFTGYATDGGHAELCVAEAAYVFPLPDGCGRTLPALIHRERCFR